MKQCISGDWQPSDVTLQLLAQNNINREFSLSQVLEFRIYWGERGIRHHAWNSKFLKHVMHEWRRHEVQVAQGQSMHIMYNEWQPLQRALDILARTNINVEFAQKQLPEFVLYWMDRGDMSNTWNSRFIQHVRYKFQNQLSSGVVPSHKTSVADDLNNRDWAAGYKVIDHESK
jgi:hypothetical protein